jgi:hypothetical protein
MNNLPDLSNTIICKMPPSDAIKILISLVETAHKRGAFSIEETYLAFNAIHTFSSDISYDNVYNYIKNRII